MRTGRMILVVTIALVLCGATLAMAQEHGSKDEAVALANAAIEHAKKAGPEQAFKDFTTDKAHWTKKDLYVIVIDMAHDEKVDL